MPMVKDVTTFVSFAYHKMSHECMAKEMRRCPKHPDNGFIW